MDQADLKGHLYRTYIGDGVYASFDGWQIWLQTQREFGIHEIALEPGVVLELENLIKRIRTESLR